VAQELARLPPPHMQVVTYVAQELARLPPPHTQVVTYVAQELARQQPLWVKQQLPDALCAAGAGGHLDALACLLCHPSISSKPLLLAAEHAGS